MPALRTSKALTQRPPEPAQHRLISPVPDPEPKLLRLHHTRPGQNRHMMRNGRLRKMNTLLDIRSAQPHILANRTPALFLKRTQDPPPCRVRDSMQNAIQFLLRMTHGQAINHESTDVNIRTSDVSYHNRNVPALSTIEVAPGCSFTMPRKRSASSCFDSDSFSTDDRPWGCRILVGG